MNELNKIQRFLGKQCTIWSKDRTILRRGQIDCRTKDWRKPSRKFIFFLFNDILLWTSKRGELQHANYLQNCKVEPADSRTRVENKFQITFQDNKDMTLMLECDTAAQRNEWYDAILNASQPSSMAIQAATRESIMGVLGISDALWNKAEAKINVLENTSDEHLPRTESKKRDYFYEPSKKPSASISLIKQDNGPADGAFQTAPYREPSLSGDGFNEFEMSVNFEQQDFEQVLESKPESTSDRRPVESNDLSVYLIERKLSGDNSRDVRSDGTELESPRSFRIVRQFSRDVTDGLTPPSAMSETLGSGSSLQLLESKDSNLKSTIIRRRGWSLSDEASFTPKLVKLNIV